MNNPANLKMLRDEMINLFYNTNAMIAAETMEGANGNKVYTIPHDRLTLVL